MPNQDNRHDIINGLVSLKGLACRPEFSNFKIDLYREIKRIERAFGEIEMSAISEVRKLRVEAHQFGLEAPIEFWAVAPEDIVARIGRGGCGPGMLGDLVIPDKILGLDIHGACLIHDFSYNLLGGHKINPIERQEIDARFARNMKRIIIKKSHNRFIRSARLWVAEKYFEAVRIGGEAYES